MIAGPALRIAKLSVALPAKCDREFAVREVSLDVRRGEIVCLVGESGSGKSILALTVMGLLPRGFPGASGSASLEGEAPAGQDGGTTCRKPGVTHLSGRPGFFNTPAVTAPPP